MGMRTLGALLALVLLAGADDCGGDDEPKRAEPKPEGCTPECDGADDESKFVSQTYVSLTCTWHCTSRREYVSITYNKVGRCYYVEHTYKSDGICD